MADILNNLGVLAKVVGDYDRARPLYERALAIREERLGPRHPRVADTLNNLGLLLFEQGLYDDALPLYRRALSIFEEQLGPEHPRVAQIAVNLANLLEEEGLDEEAESLYERSLAITEKRLGKDHPFVATILYNLAFLFDKRNDFVRSRAFYERVLAIETTTLGPDHPDLLFPLNNLGRALLERGRFEEAEPHLERALALCTANWGRAHPVRAEILYNLALLAWKRGRFAESRHFFLEGAATIDGHVEKIFPVLSFAEQTAFLEGHLRRGVSDLLSTCQEEGALRPAYALLFRWKGLLLESLRRQSVIARLAAEDPRLQPKVAELTALRHEIATAFHEIGEIPLAEWQQANAERTARKEALERALSRSVPPMRLRDPLAGIDLAAFQRLLAPNEAFIDLYRYWRWEGGTFGEDRYAAVVTMATKGPRFLDLGPAERVEETVGQWREAVRRGEETDAEWKELFTRLWVPISAKLPSAIEEVVLSPDGELGRIPWHLLAASDSRHPRRLTLIGSAREWVRLERLPPLSREAAPTLLLAGGIDFGTERVGGSRVAIPPLPWTLEEVERIAALARRRGFKVHLLTGKRADKARIVAELGRARFAHLATHGFFLHASPPPRPEGRLMTFEPLAASKGRRKRERNPLIRSGILLAGGEASTWAEAPGGWLTAEEIVGLDLSGMALLTLSACDTGRGTEVT
ncbi:MAG: CHAT domain-containing protein, partial [Deltaproteobacteria bacterium]